ncbi:hypothetical protein, partial [Actinobacillus pleuropneumoniae]
DLGFSMKSFVNRNRPLLGNLTLYRKIAVSRGILKSEPFALPITDALLLPIFDMRCAVPPHGGEKGVPPALVFPSISFVNQISAPLAL